MRELYDRVAGRLNHARGEITRAEFRTYAADFLREGASPAWKSPGDEADKTFRDLDRDGDGTLKPDEMSESLRATLPRWDANRDGVIDRNEYATYFIGRVTQVAVEQATAPASIPAPNISPRSGSDGDKLMAYRFGHQPSGAPEWITTLDADYDGQIGLYEWRQASKPINEFQAMDLNRDGFITGEEWLRWARAAVSEAAKETKLADATKRTLPLRGDQRPAVAGKSPR